MRGSDETAMSMVRSFFHLFSRLLSSYITRSLLYERTDGVKQVSQLLMTEISFYAATSCGDEQDFSL